MPGLTLAERLDDIGKKEPVDAVRFALRIADALSSLHEAGACHGSVHPRGILIQVEGHAPPVLGYFPSTDVSFRSAERGNEDPPTESDDSWAAAALLHKMLLGTTPPRDGYSSETEVTDAGVTDAALTAALAHALNKDVEQRSRDVRPLKRELARWFVEHAGEEPATPGPHSSSPPAIASEPARSKARPLRCRRAGHRLRRQRRPKRACDIIPLAVAGIVVGLLERVDLQRHAPPSSRSIEIHSRCRPPSAAPAE